MTRSDGESQGFMVTTDGRRADWMTAGTSGDAGTGAARVYLVRHGQTALNESGVLRGHLDPPLDDTGRHQAQKVGLVLGARQPAVIIASPLRRAIQTAEPIAERAGLVEETDECLMDRDYGEWAGVPRQDVIDRWGSVDAAPGVEPQQTVRARAVDGLSAIARRCSGQAAVVVSHDAVTRQVLMALDPGLGDADELPQDNGCYNALEWHDGFWTVLSVNELPAEALSVPKKHPPCFTGRTPDRAVRQALQGGGHGKRCRIRA